MSSHGNKSIKAKRKNIAGCDESTKRNSKIKKLIQSDESSNHTEYSYSEPKIDADDNLKKIKNANSKNIDNMPVIGGHYFNRNQKAKRILPNWLLCPTVISTDLSNLDTKLDDIDLSSLLKRNLEINSYMHYLPVQAKVVPWILENNHQQKNGVTVKPSRDVCVSSPTGSGKTLAYVLPIINTLKNRIVPRIRALIVVPVQQLALQVAKVFEDCAKGTDLKVLATCGGNIPLETEQKILIKKMIGSNNTNESKIDILVTTPGRLVEHLKKTVGFELKYLKYLVIDEADRVMDGMQNDWLHHVEKYFLTEGIQGAAIFTLNFSHKRIAQPQKLLFSATLSQDAEKLKQLNLFQPKLFTSVVTSKGVLNEGSKNEFIGKFCTPQELEEYYGTIANTLKPLVICYLLEKGWNKILCFMKSVNESHKLLKILSHLCPRQTFKEISSLLPPKDQSTVLTNFESGKIDMLICSDCMARGVDIPSVRYVISYDPPKNVKGYIHRAGRTGRAGSKGTVLTFVTSTQVTGFLQKLKDVNKENLKEMVFKDDFSSRLNNYYKALKAVGSQTQIKGSSQRSRKKRAKT